MTNENDCQRPENDLCASSVFAEALAAQVNQQDVECMIQAQKHMMLRFEKTNEMLINCNALSTVRFHVACQEFKRHTQLLVDTKKDLDVVFRRIRNLKAKLSNQYSEAFIRVSSDASEVTEEADGGAITTAPFSEKQGCKSISMGKNTANSSSCSQATTPSLASSSSSSDSG